MSWRHWVYKSHLVFPALTVLADHWNIHHQFANDVSNWCGYQFVTGFDQSANTVLSNGAEDIQLAGHFLYHCRKVEYIYMVKFSPLAFYKFKKNMWFNFLTHPLYLYRTLKAQYFKCNSHCFTVSRHFVFYLQLQILFYKLHEFVFHLFNFILWLCLVSFLTCFINW